MFDELGSSYKKLAITSSDGETEVGEVEVTRWDTGNEEAELWFRAPIDGDSDTQFYLYFDSSHTDNTNVKDPGSATALWPTSSNEYYIAVYHMGEATGDLQDSTANNNDATVADLESRQVDGYNGGYAVSFEPQDYLTLGDLDLEGDELTVFVVANVESDQAVSGTWVGCFPNTDQYIFYIKHDGGGDYVRALIYPTNAALQTIATDPSDLSLGEWAVWVNTYDRGTATRIYKDGTIEASITPPDYGIRSPYPSDFEVSVGALDTDGDGWDDSNYFDGQLDCIIIAQSAFNQSQIDVITSGFEDDLVEWDSVEYPSGSSVLLNLTYGYDKSGSVTSIYDAVENVTEIYSYDLLDRLTQTMGPWGTVSYAYDSVGNRLSKSVEGGSTVSYTHDNMDRLVSATGMGFDWDSNGNMIYMDDGVLEWNYTYDPLNRLTRVLKDDSLSAIYTYDAGGRRVRSWDTVDDTIDYVYSGLNIIDEISSSTHEKHVYAGSIHIASSTNGTVEYYHVDHLGSTRLKTNSSGGVVYESNYEPFGPSSGESGSEDYRYTGKHEDPSGLYYFGARYYNPVLGRFTTRDTVFGDQTDPQSQNRYVYCRNNPQKYIDPDGNCLQSIIIKTTIMLGWAEMKALQAEVIYLADHPGDYSGAYYVGKLAYKKSLYAQSISSLLYYVGSVNPYVNKIVSNRIADIVFTKKAQNWHYQGVPGFEDMPEDYLMTDELISDTILDICETYSLNWVNEEMITTLIEQGDVTIGLESETVRFYVEGLIRGTKTIIDPLLDTSGQDIEALEEILGNESLK